MITPNMQVLLPKYCKKCGKKLVRTDEEVDSEYDRQTGQEIKTRSFTLVCPSHKKWSITDEHDYFEYVEAVD